MLSPGAIVVDLEGIGVTRLRQRTMRQHRALGLAGGARCVKQPGEIAAVARRRRHRIGIAQRVPAGAADPHKMLQRLRRVRRDRRLEPIRREAHPRAGMLKNVAKLRAMQLGIGRHRRETRVPDGEQQLDIFGAVLRGDGDAIAGLEAELVAQRAGQARNAARQRGIVMDDTGAMADGRARTVASAGAFEPQRNIHLKLDRVEPAEADRVALAAQQRHGFVQRQADDIGVGADDLDDESAGDALRGIAAGLAAPFAGGEIALRCLPPTAA